VPLTRGLEVVNKTADQRTGSVLRRSDPHPTPPWAQLVPETPRKSRTPVGGRSAGLSLDEPGPVGRLRDVPAQLSTHCGAGCVELRGELALTGEATDCAWA